MLSHNKERGMWLGKVTCEESPPSLEVYVHILVGLKGLLELEHPSSLQSHGFVALNVSTTVPKYSM